MFKQTLWFIVLLLPWGSRRPFQIKYWATDSSLNQSPVLRRLVYVECPPGEVICDAENDLTSLEAEQLSCSTTVSLSLFLSHVGFVVSVISAAHPALTPSGRSCSQFKGEQVCGDDAKASLAGLGEYVAAETLRAEGMSTDERFLTHSTVLLAVLLCAITAKVIGSGSCVCCRAGGNRPPSAAVRARVNKHPAVQGLRTLHSGKGTSV